MANLNIANDLYNDYVQKGDSITSSTAIKGKSAEDMGMDEFFTLLTAQMTNQDMMNPESNTEFIAQMAQFTSLQGMKTLQEYQLSNYAVTYAGKDVTIAAINESTGDMETIKGTVERVTFYDGAPQVVVNGTAYPLHQVMEVNTDVAEKNEQTSGNSLSLVSGYIGQNVTVTDTSNPEFPKNITGEVTSVTLRGGKPYVIVDGKEYPYTSITAVGVSKTEETGSEEETESETDTSETGASETDKD